jgi:peptidoglycan/xylan/chitin deacetylase (PgdA/CDA1 family)
MDEFTTKLLKATLRAFYHSRLDELLAPVTRGAGAIFMLHHVVPAPPPAFAPNRILTITPKFAEFVLDYVTGRGFDIVTMDEAWERMQSRARHDRPFAVFTFDDGYRDNITHALPVFRRFEAPMLIYAAPDFCDHQGRAWWLTLEEVLREADRISVPFDDGAREFGLATTDEKYAAFRAIYPWLRAMPDIEIHDHVNRWAEESGIDPVAACRDLVMTWDEMRAFRDDPLVTFGAHTMSHVALAKCDDDDARFEIEASVEHIEYELARDCRHFAYPYGDRQSAGPRDFELVRRAGLRTAVTTRKGLIPADVGDGMWSLPRFSLNGDYQDERFFRVLLNGAPFKMLNLAQQAFGRAA